MNIGELIGIAIYIGISYLIADKIGRYKTVGFWGSFLLCLALSPFLGYLISEMVRQENPKGCKWCGNKYNEAEYCGICGKNDAGEIKPGFVEKKK